MEAAARLPAINPTPPLLGELGLLADGTRGRMLACLDKVELTVVELCDSLALPQSTVSRHLKLLADAGWVAARRDGTSRRYVLTIDQLDERSQRLWAIVHESLAESAAVRLDERRREQVLQRRRRRHGDVLLRRRGRVGSRARRAVRRDERPAAAARPARPRCRRRRSRLRLGPRWPRRSRPTRARVVAVDASPEMLEVARARLAGFDNVQIVRRAASRSSRSTSATLDLALVVHLLHHVADPSAALAEVARVLRPGGRLVVADVLPHPYDDYRRTMGHVWLGFDRPTIETAFADAGLGRRALARARRRAGRTRPGLFVATAIRPPRLLERDQPPKGRRMAVAPDTHPFDAARRAPASCRTRSPTSRWPSSAATRSASPSRRCPA